MAKEESEFLFQFLSNYRLWTMDMRASYRL